MMLEQIWQSRLNAARERMQKQGRYIPLRQERVTPRWQRYAIDSLLAIVGVVLVTWIIATVHLYPGFPSIVLTYLLLITALAGMRGIYAALLATFLADFSFDFFFTPPLYVFSLSDLTSMSADDLLDPWIFLATGLITALLATALRRRAEQARHRERETRLFAQQAKELSALQERQRLARELHDSIFQALYGINMGVHTAREALESEPDEAIIPLEYVIELTEMGLAEMRALIFELRPESLATEGLIAALTRQVNVLRIRYKLTVDAQLGEEPALSQQCKHTLYRVFQEALHNIVKHANATRVTIQLARQNNWLNLEVRDDGKGFDSHATFPGHFGLDCIRERVAQLNGSCIIESLPSQGTHIHVSIPIYGQHNAIMEEAEHS